MWHLFGFRSGVQCRHGTFIGCRSRPLGPTCCSVPERSAPGCSTLKRCRRVDAVRSGLRRGRSRISTWHKNLGALMAMVSMPSRDIERTFCWVTSKIAMCVGELSRMKPVPTISLPFFNLNTTGGCPVPTFRVVLHFALHRGLAGGGPHQRGNGSERQQGSEKGRRTHSRKATPRTHCVGTVEHAHSVFPAKPAASRSRSPAAIATTRSRG